MKAKKSVMGLQVHELSDMVKRTKPDGSGLANKKVKRGEHVVGVLPVELRRFFTVREIAHREFEMIQSGIQRAIKEAGGAEKLADANRVELIQQQAVAFQRLDFVETGFWSAVRCAFPKVVTCRHVDIKEGWQIVTPHKECIDVIVLGCHCDLFAITEMGL